LREVTAKARREEIARMLGGKSDSALELAASLLAKRSTYTAAAKTDF
jgi:DNA repair ATPase RecN